MENSDRLDQIEQAVLAAHGLVDPIPAGDANTDDYGACPLSRRAYAAHMKNFASL